jgi:hypothetical protein
MNSKTLAASEMGSSGKQEFRRTDFGSRLLAAEGEGGGEDRCG